jgi:hypothetical protein
MKPSNQNLAFELSHKPFTLSPVYTPGKVSRRKMTKETSFTQIKHSTTALRRRLVTVTPR